LLTLLLALIGQLALVSVFIFGFALVWWVFWGKNMFLCCCCVFFLGILTVVLFECVFVL